jgi:hypothetical protein
MKTLKKIIFVTVLLSLTFRVLAPIRVTMNVAVPSPVQPYRKLINAIGKVETNYDTIAYNPEEKAVGIFQIRPIRLEDYNKRTGNRYKMKDLYNYEISEKIFLYYASEIGPYDFEKIAKRWNGSGPKTSYYWKRVKMAI